MLAVGGEQQVVTLPIATPEGATAVAIAPEVTYVEASCDPQTTTEIQYVKDEDGNTYALNMQENLDAGEVQTIMVEVPYGQKLDANSIMSLLQQHQQ